MKHSKSSTKSNLWMLNLRKFLPVNSLDEIIIYILQDFNISPYQIIAGIMDLSTCKNIMLVLTGSHCFHELVSCTTIQHTVTLAQHITCCSGFSFSLEGCSSCTKYGLSNDWSSQT